MTPVLGSLLSLLTVSAVVLLVPVLAGLLGTHRRTHLALEDSTRRVRLVIAASVVGLAALGVAALLGAGPAAALSVAGILAGAVLAWSPMAGSWAVRGVVAWALLFAGALAVLGWLVEQMLASSMSPTELVISGVAWGFLLLSLSRVQRYARDLIGAHAGLGRQTWGRRRRISLLRPALSLVVLFAAGGAVGLAANHTGPARGRVPQAGLPGSGTSEVAAAVPVSAPTVTRGGTSRPMTAEAERAALAALSGGDPVLDTPRLRAPTPVATLSALGAVTGTGASPSTSVRAEGPSAAASAGTGSASTDAGTRDGAAAVAPTPTRLVTRSPATNAGTPTAHRASRKTSIASATGGPGPDTSAGAASVPVSGVPASPGPVIPDASTTPRPRHNTGACDATAGAAH